MTLNPRKMLNDWQDAWREDWARDLDDPNNLMRAAFDANVFDHGFVRALYANLHDIGDGVWRSNQPSPAQLERLKARGFRSVINLRGHHQFGSYHLEKMACARLGLDFHTVRLLSRRTPYREKALEFLDVLARAERPVLLHCKSGADRAGIASAMHVLVSRPGDIAAAKAQLNWRYGHFRSAKTGVLDMFVTVYGEAYAATGIGFRDWLETGYDEATVKRRFTANRWSGLFVDRILGRE